MQDLQQAFGEVVDAAIAGDFSRRVGADFPDAELNSLAGSVNALVETVDRGLSETGTVLAALAETDLTQRMNGDYAGAFAQLKADTNRGGRKPLRHRRPAQEDLVRPQDRDRRNPRGRQRPLRTHHRQAATIEETSAAMEQLAGTVLQNAERASDASANAGAVTRAAEDGGAVMAAGDRGDGADHRLVGQDLQHHRHDRRHRLPDQPAGAERVGRSGACRRSRQGLCRRRRRSAPPGAVGGRGLVRGQGADRAERHRSRRRARGWSPRPPRSSRRCWRRRGATTTLLDGIARESREQASSIDEVNAAVRQMDEMTQHNAALVEETNAAIEQTEAQAVELDRIVDVFTVEEVEERPVAKPKPAPGARALQDQVRRAAKSYLSSGNTAVATDWSEF